MVMVHENEEHVILQYLSDRGSIKNTVECYNISKQEIYLEIYILQFIL